LLAAARLLEGKVDAVDINFGCPQGIAKRGNYGSFLLDKPNVMRALISTLHNHLGMPVTAKIRILPSEEDTMKLAMMCQEAGASILTVHGRTKESKKDATGPNNFAIINRIKESLSIPVFSNGGIETYEDVETCLKFTGVDGVMSSESLLCNPGLFAGTGPYPLVNPIAMAFEYLDLALKYKADPSAVRGHLFKILHQELFAFIDLRVKLATSPMSAAKGILDELKARDEKLTPIQRKELYGKFSTWYRRWSMFGGKGGDDDDGSGTGVGATEKKARSAQNVDDVSCSALFEDQDPTADCCTGTETSKLAPSGPTNDSKSSA